MGAFASVSVNDHVLEHVSDRPDALQLCILIIVLTLCPDLHDVGVHVLRCTQLLQVHTLTYPR